MQYLCASIPPSRQVPTTKETISHPFALHEVYAACGHRQPFTRKVGGARVLQRRLAAALDAAEL